MKSTVYNEDHFFDFSLQGAFFFVKICGCLSQKLNSVCDQRFDNERLSSDRIGYSLLYHIRL